MPRDHISDFESNCERNPVEGDGSDSGEVYSRLTVREVNFSHVQNTLKLTFRYFQSVLWSSPYLVMFRSQTALLWDYQDYQHE